MSDSPPPFGEEEKEVEQQQAAAPSTIDIDLNDDKTPEEDTTAAEAAAAASTESEAAKTANRQSANPPSDDLFFSTISDPEQHNESKNNSKTEDMDEIFRANKPPQSATASAVAKAIEDDDDPFSPSNPKNNDTPAPATVAVEPEAAKPAAPKSPVVQEKMTDLTEALKKQSLTAGHSLYSSLPEEDDEDKDKFINIVLSDPHKVGDGMGAYMVYKITTSTNYPMFKAKEFTTSRRFSDFLALYEKLKEKHLPAGRILPPAPEKDMLGTAKVKMSKEDQGPGEFIGKRRAALERFLMRLAKHKSFRYDPDFRDFLEIGDDLPRASNTSALSGAGMLKMFKNVTDSVTKIAFKMEETDQWFEEKSRQVENLYVQYKKLHAMIDLLYGWRKDLAASVKDFSKSIAILSNAEEQLALSRALSQLGEVYEKIDAIYLDQANSDYFTFGELVKDYVSLFDNVKEVFYQRIKTFGLWQKAEETLKAKKEAKAKLEASNKQDKIPAAAAEIKDWEGKVEKSKEEFEQISKTIKEEVKRFDLVRANEFRAELTKYVEKMYQNQENIVKL